MNDELQDKLYAAAPKLCSTAFGGFCIPDSWFDLMLEAVVDLEALDPDLRLAQVKIKWGGLRIYLTQQPVGADTIILCAESRASLIR